MIMVVERWNLAHVIARSLVNAVCCFNGGISHVCDAVYSFVEMASFDGLHPNNQVCVST